MSQPFYYNQAAHAINVGPPGAGAGRGMQPVQMGMSPAQYMQQAQFRNPPPADRKRPMAKPARTGGAAPAEDNEEPSGDELDDISARDIAMARYKRNHDYLSEIFTPYNAASIVPPSIEISQEKDAILESIAEQEGALRKNTESFEQQLLQLQKEQKEYWKIMNNLSDATTLEEMDATAKRYGELLGVQVDHDSSNVHAIPIPGLEEDVDMLVSNPLTEQVSNHDQGYINPAGDGSGFDKQTAYNGSSNNSGPMDMFASFQDTDGPMADNPDESENNDLFNEMVNAGQDDDDGGMSEFLNTNDI